VCPHCNAEQTSDEAPGLPPPADNPSPATNTPAASEPPPHAQPELGAGGRQPVHVSREEAAALLAMDDAQHGGGPPEPPDSRPGIAAWWFLPQTGGARRVAELALTVVALPLLVLSLFWLVMMGLRWRLTGTRWLRPVSAVAASVACYAFGRGGGLSHVVAGAAVGVMLGAWIARTILRRVGYRRRVA